MSTHLQCPLSAAVDRQVGKWPVDGLDRPDRPLGQVGDDHRGQLVDTERGPLTETEQLEILALLEAASTEDSAMRAARALADLMRHLHTLGRRIAVELPDQDRDGKPAAR